MIDKIKDLKITPKARLILSLATVVVILCLPAVLDSTNVPEIAQAGENLTSITPTSNPVESKTPEPTPTPEPAKTVIPKPPTTSKKRTDAPTRSYSGTGTTTQSQPSRANTPTSSSPASQPQTSTPQPTSSGILGYINQARADNGLVLLTYNSQLNSAAKSKSQDMLDNNYFSHTSPDGRSDFDFIRAAGYSFSFAGSNIAKGSFSEKSVFEAWMNSAGHRDNILDARAREFGYGIAGNYFTMMVGAR